MKRKERSKTVSLTKREVKGFKKAQRLLHKKNAKAQIQSSLDDEMTIELELSDEDYDRWCSHDPEYDYIADAMFCRICDRWLKMISFNEESEEYVAVAQPETIHT